ncbi:MAG: ABC transporter substrate-binding protein [Woeseiaceae bacterium]|nr:ABC transporter substrate-binding protein [Woeseiaceae bacterium]
MTGRPRRFAPRDDGPQLPALGRHFIVGLILCAGLAAAAEPDTGSNTVPADWAQIQSDASGQTVYFNAWGGDPGINRYLAWAAEELRAQHDLRLVHVKVTDVAEAVSRIMAEKAAGRDEGGSVDLLWINGENFAALKRANLLWGPWAERVPHAALIDWQDNPTTRIDMTLPTEGFELPWGSAAFTLFYHEPQVPLPPNDPAALLAWIEQHPGRFSYPQPPSFLGSAFLKQLLLLLTDERERLLAPAGDDFADITEPLWQWLDRAHIAMWRGGRLFPPSGPAQRELLAVGELDWMMSYNPSEASRAIRQQELHETIGALHFSGGALANSHFLAIPVNASAKAGAMVAADFLLSPRAQARKADERYWGDPTVLDMARLTTTERGLFDKATTGAATPPAPEKFLPEPHPSWTTRLEAAWLRRYVR